MTFAEYHDLVTETIGGNTAFFLDEAERLIKDYEAGNAVGDPADPGVFVSWIATVMRHCYLGGIDIAFNAIQEAGGKHGPQVGMGKDGKLLIDRSPAFLTAARELSDYIGSLDLTPEQNGRLIQLMADNVSLAERDAFRQGEKLPIEYKTFTPVEDETEDGAADE